MNFTSVTNSFSQKNSISLAYSSKHPRVLENSSYFFWKILNYKRKNPNFGEFQVKISDERQGKTFRGSIVWTLNLLPAFLSGCLLSYSLRYDFQKINIYLSQLKQDCFKMPWYREFLLNFEQYSRYKLFAVWKFYGSGVSHNLNSVSEDFIRSLLVSLKV